MNVLYTRRLEGGVISGIMCRNDRALSFKGPSLSFTLTFNDRVLRLIVTWI